MADNSPQGTAAGRTASRAASRGSGQAGGTPTGEGSSGDTLHRALTGLRLRARRVLLVRAVAMVLGCLLGGLLLVVLTDFVFRLPGLARWVLLAGGLVGVGWMVRTWIVRAGRFSPSLTSVALRVESARQGSAVRGDLASALELSEETGGTQAQAAMRARAVEHARRALTEVPVGRLIRTEPARRGVALFVAAAVLAGGAGLAWPALASIGLARLLTPWSQAQWPKRTGVASATGTEVHAAGEPIVLRALLTKTNHALGQSEVSVRMRVVRRVEGREVAEPWRTLALAPQRREDRFGDAVGEVYERLSETPMLENEAVLEYRFVSADDQTEVQSLRLAPRPRLVGITLDAAPPAYAREAGVTGVLAGEGLELDASSRVVSAALPVLAESRVVVGLKFNKEMPAWSDPIAVARDQLGDASLASALAASEDHQTGATTWTLTLHPTAQVSLTVMPVDALGLTPAAPTTLRLEVIQDEPPAVAVIDPSRDEAVVPTALLGVLGEARDDIGLRTLQLVAQRAAAPEGSIGAQAQSVADEVVLAETVSNAALDQEVSAELSIEAMGARAGDEVWLWALASDVHESEGEPREPIRSSRRTLRIIDEGELETQIRSELSAIRRSAMRLEQQQREVRKQVERDAQDPRVSGQQESLTRRIGAQQGAMERLSKRLERNQMDESSLAGLLEDASAIAEDAAEASQRAERELGARENDQEQAQQAAQRAAEAQDEVRAALSDLIAALDRGEDAWVARRGVEQLLEEQKRIAADTAKMGQKAAGRTLDQLSEDERTELERILERQQRAADAGREAIEELDRRADQLAGRDPAQASALRDAASRGRSSQLEQRQDDAAQNLSENQTSDAGENQQQAIEALEEMLDEIDQADQRRDEVLRRILASLMDSIDSLIAQQIEQIEALAAAKGKDLGSLDAGMIRLDANTLAVIQLAQEAPGEIDPLVGLLNGAHEQQALAIEALRANKEKPATKREAKSLELLKQAKDEAKKLDEEAQKREADRRLDDLKTAYRELLERQVMLQAEVDAFVGQEITRRQRAKVRGLGEQQRTLGGELSEVRQANKDLEQTHVFTLALDRIDSASESASQRLRKGRADHRVQRSQATVAGLLRSMLEALEDAKPPEDEFAEGAQESSGGGGGASGGEQPLVPPVAELKLLRAMQIEAASWTRSIDEHGAEEGELDELSALQQSLGERGKKLIEQLQQATPQPGGRGNGGGNGGGGGVDVDQGAREGAQGGEG